MALNHCCRYCHINTTDPWARPHWTVPACSPGIPRDESKLLYQTFGKRRVERWAQKLLWSLMRMTWQWATTLHKTFAYKRRQRDQTVFGRQSGVKKSTFFFFKIRAIVPCFMLRGMGFSKQRQERERMYTQKESLFNRGKWLGAHKGQAALPQVNISSINCEMHQEKSKLFSSPISHILSALKSANSLLLMFPLTAFLPFSPSPVSQP